MIQEYADKLVLFWHEDLEVALVVLLELAPCQLPMQSTISTPSFWIYFCDDL
jgi:hypothetical protein